MLIKGITLFLYLWVAALLHHKDVGLVFTLGDYQATGGVVLVSMLGVTLFCWGVTYWLGPRRRWLTVLNLFVGGATLGGLASLLLGINQWTNRRDYLYYRPWSHVQITYPEEVHCRVWQETFLQTLGGVAPPEGATPAVGSTLRETTQFARETALTYLDELARLACTSPPPQPTSYSWFYVGLGVVVGLVLLGGLLIYLNTPPPPPGSPPPPGGPPSPETPPWWTKPEAAEVKPVVSSPKWKPEDYDELIALVSGNSATGTSGSSPSSPPEGEFGLDEVISYFESLPPAPVRPRSPSKFTIEDVEALFERAPRAARAAPGTTTADVLAAPRPRGAEGLLTRASAVRGPRPAPPVRTPREAAELYLDQNYSSVSSTPLTGAARAELVSAMASAVTGMAEFAAELHGGRTIVNPPTEEVPPRRSRPAGVFTPLSAFPDLPPPPPRRTRAEELYGPDSGIWDYIAEVEAESRRNFPPGGGPGKTPK